MTYVISIETDHPDGEQLVRQAAQLVVTRVDWGEHHTTSIELVEHSDGEDDRYIAGWELAPA